MPLFLAEVSSVDKNNYTCSVQPVDDAQAERVGVRLLPIESESPQGLVCFPKVGTMVLCARFEKEEFFVISVFEVESFIFIVSDQFKMEVNKDGETIFNDGQNEGLVKAPELKAQVDKNTAILQAIKNVLEGSIINEVGNGAPSVLQAALSTVTLGKPTADLSNIQNTKIKH